MVKLRTILCLFIVFLWLVPVAAFAATVQAVADRDRMTAGESLHLELRVEGSADGDPDLSVLDKDWEVLGRSQNSQIQIVNGSFNRSLVYSLTLMPRREGELTIPAVCFGSDCSLPLPITVTAAGAAAVPAQDAQLLLETEVEPARVISQAQVLFKVRLLHRSDLLQGSLSEPQPAGVEAVVQKLGEDRKYETRRGGRLYQVIERKYAIFPQAAGTLKIPPLQFDGAIAGGASRFDPFGGGGERVRRYSPARQVVVTPPPADRAGRAWLPARALRLNDDWQGKTMQLTVGEPTTRTLTLTAEGLQAAQLPQLQLEVPAGFKNYPDQPERLDHPGDAGITGVLQQKIALVPTRPGHYRLPAIDLDWWDIAANKWQQAHLNPVDIEVSPAAGGAGAPASAGPLPAIQPPPTATRPEKPAIEPVPSGAGATLLRPSQAIQPGFWPWLCLALGLGWLATLLVVWRQRSQMFQRSAEAPEPSPSVREKTARQAVLQAARNNDPQATRQALSAWSAILRPRSGRPDPELFCRIAPAPLREAIEELNRALYAPGGQRWTGAALIEAVRQWCPQAQDAAAGDTLPDLYPD